MAVFMGHRDLYKGRMVAPSFYESVPSFASFDEITNPEHFVRVPDDWHVVITDVKGSTQAIEAGRYNDVNMIGAAAIAAVQNRLAHAPFPYVFGGDGATLLIASSDIDGVLEALCGLKRLAAKRFDLGLRVGSVPVATLTARGAVIDVARYELAHGKCVAIFRGGGLTVAETMVKAEAADYEATQAGNANVDLRGLSCRWNEIPNARGTVLSLLVVARHQNDHAVYDEVLRTLSDLCDGGIPAANPVNLSLMSYQKVRTVARKEARYHDSRWSLGFMARFMEIVAAVLVFKWKVPPIFFKPKRYVGSLRAHSDYRKFDDMLRMVIDCSPDQVARIRTMLTGLQAAGRVHYGLHESPTSLMTCYLHGLGDGEHIHFIDGGDGGYAMAAKELKAQMKEAVAQP